MLCTRCKKRQAVVFVQRLENGKPVQEGYCLTCARELHIQPVDDLMKRFNMTDDQLASMEEHGRPDAASAGKRRHDAHDGRRYAEPRRYRG